MVWESPAKRVGDLIHALTMLLSWITRLALMSDALLQNTIKGYVSKSVLPWGHLSQFSLGKCCLEVDLPQLPGVSKSVLCFLLTHLLRQWFSQEKLSEVRKLEWITQNVRSAVPRWEGTAVHPLDGKDGVARPADHHLWDGSTLVQRISPISLIGSSPRIPLQIGISAGRRFGAGPHGYGRYGL